MSGVCKVRPLHTLTFYKQLIWLWDHVLIKEPVPFLSQSLWPLSVDVFVPSLAVSVCPQQCIFPISSDGTVKFSLSQKLILPPQLPPLLIRPGESCVSWRRRRGESMPYRLFGPAGRAPRYFRKPVDLVVWLAASLDTPPTHRHIPFPPTSPSGNPTWSITPLEPFSAFHLQREAITHTPPHMITRHRGTFPITASARWFCPLVMQVRTCSLETATTAHSPQTRSTSSVF